MLWKAIPPRMMLLVDPILDKASLLVFRDPAGIPSDAGQHASNFRAPAKTEMLLCIGNIYFPTFIQNELNELSLSTVETIPHFGHSFSCPNRDLRTNES